MRLMSLFLIAKRDKGPKEEEYQLTKQGWVALI